MEDTFTALAGSLFQCRMSRTARNRRSHLDAVARNKAQSFVYCHSIAFWSM